MDAFARSFEGKSLQYRGVAGLIVGRVRDARAEPDGTVSADVELNEDGRKLLDFSSCPPPVQRYTVSVVRFDPEALKAIQEAEAVARRIGAPDWSEADPEPDVVV